MSSVTINGNTYTDDDNPTTGLAGGGHRTRFIPALQDVVAVITGVAGMSLNRVDGHASGTLTATDCLGTSIDNVGQVAAVDLQLPEATAGMNFMVIAGTTPGAYAWRIRAAVTDKFYLNGVAGSDNGYVGIAVPTVGAFISVFSFKTGVSTYDWFVSVGNGNWGVI